MFLTAQSKKECKFSVPNPFVKSSYFYFLKSLEVQEGNRRAAGRQKLPVCVSLGVCVCV